MTAGEAVQGSEVDHLRARVSTLEADNAKLTAANVALQKAVAHLKSLVFGRKRERYGVLDQHPQLPFPSDEPEPVKPPHVDEAPDEEFETVTFKRRRGATRITKDLPCEVVRLELPEDQRRCECCNEAKDPIGEEVSEQIDYTPAICRRIRTVRVKYACKQHEECGVATAAVPPAPVEKGMATAGLLSHVLVSKYKDHLPPHRQCQIFARRGVEFAESTLCDRVKQAAEMLTPVVAATKSSILASKVVQSDDTGITVLDPDRPKGSRRSFLWAYIDDRGEVVFDFTDGRDHSGPCKFLGDYRGYLQVDAYSGYEGLRGDPADRPRR